MEETVLRIVDEISDEDESSASPRYCNSADCRTDAACYVLNRIPQRYVSSQRGQAHVEYELQQDRQVSVDIVTLAHEGLRRVSSVRRPFYGDGDTSAHRHTGPRFCMPTVKGRLFDGASFELVTDVPVELLLDDDRVAMLDARWQNPYRIAANTAGTYLFWPRPVAAEREGMERSFELEIRVESVRYELFRHYFVVNRTSITQVPDPLEMGGEHRLPDLYLLPAEDGRPGV